MHASRFIEEIHQRLVRLADQGRDFLLAVVLETHGSTPCKAGAKAIMDAAGVIQGTIGGGLVEAETQRRAAETIRSGRPCVLDFDLDGRDVSDAPPICGGAMRVLMDPCASSRREVYATADSTLRGRQRGVLLTAVQGRREWDVAVRFLAEPSIAPGLGFPGAQAVRAALEREKTRLFVRESTPEGERLEVLVEPLLPKPLLLIVGGGHVGQALAAQASLVGFDLVVVDDRPEFTRPELFPDGATTRCGAIGQVLADVPLGGDAYVVIVTRDHQHDADALAACLHEPVAYLGMIGSQRKVAMIRKRMVDSGRVASRAFDRVYAPIGLDIGAVTVPEIAASIVAQLIAVRRAGAAPRIAARQNVP